MKIRKAGSIAFLMGLRELNETTRRLSEKALAQRKTDRSFQVLSKQIHDADWRIRWQAMDVLSRFRQPRCAEPLLDVLANDSKPPNRAGAAVRLEDYPEERVKTALLRAMRGNVKVAQSAAFSLAGLQVEAAIEPAVSLLRSGNTDLDRRYILRALSRYSGAKARARIDDLTKDLPQQSRVNLDRKPSASAKPDELVFRISLHSEKYRLGDPIAIDLALENRSVSPARTVPPGPDPWQLRVDCGIRLERLGERPVLLIDHEPNGAGGSHSPPACTLRRGETFVRRDCLHAWLSLENEGIWPLPAGKYRLTAAFDNTQLPKEKWPVRLEDDSSTDLNAESELPEIKGRWQTRPVEFEIAGPARTDPAELLDFIGKEAGRPELLDSRLRKLGYGRMFGDEDVVRIFGDARLLPFYKSHDLSLFFTASHHFFFFNYGRSFYEQGVLAGPRKLPAPADKPAMTGREGQQALNDLADVGMEHRHPAVRSPAYSYGQAINALESPFAAERERQARYILAVAAQSLADESNGRCKWKQSVAWGGGMESKTRELRGYLAKAFAEVATAAEALDVALWLINNDPIVENQCLGGRALCQNESPRVESVFRRLLAQPHTNQSVLVNILGQVTLRRLVSLAPEVRRLADHYRKAVSTAARNAACELGIADLPPYRPEDAFSPWLEAELNDIVAMVEAPIAKDTPWKEFTVTHAPRYTGEESRTETVVGWLLGETANALDVLDVTGNRLRLEKKATKVSPCSLQETAGDLLSIRNAPADDRFHSPASRLSRMGSLTAQFELRYISVQEALVAAWLLQRGDKKTAAALLFPRIDATGDDRLIRGAIQQMLGNEYHLAMLAAFADARDYDRALQSARHLSGLLFDGYWYQDRAKELAEQLPKRRNDFKSFRLPRPGEWSELKKKLTRPQQIEYLAKHLRLLKGVQWGQPGGVTYDVPHYENTEPHDPSNWQKGLVINPYMELRGMYLEIADLPVLVPFLADETFTLTYGYWRNFHPGRDLHRVNRPVADIINHVARRDLAQLEEFSALDAQGKRKHLDKILQWCREHGGQTREEFLLRTLTEARAWQDFAPAASEAVAKRLRIAQPVLLRRVGRFHVARRKRERRAILLPDEFGGRARPGPAMAFQS